MRILFISSGNSANGISPIVLSQGESLVNKENIVEYYTIKGKGFWGYAKNISRLKRYLKNNKYDLIHAHYSLSAMVASLAGSKPLVVSLMGSDVKESKWFKFIIKFFNYFFWDTCIVKSEDMKKSSGLKKAVVIPNGVDIEKFKPIAKHKAISALDWTLDKKHILFPANPKRPEKNFKLAKEAFESLKNAAYELHHLNNVDNNLMPYYYNAADLVLLTSLWEGSPNVIKEAMACNCPIVTTDVGDVKWVLGDTKGCYLSPYRADNLAEKIQLAIEFGGKTQGRQRIVGLGLDSKSTAVKLIELYKELFNENK
jgi:glycosyltransferase involved in cell wall biosynthesis